jgi:KDO2-lipid IV(A) lauroyltransferase
MSLLGCAFDLTLRVARILPPGFAWWLGGVCGDAFSRLPGRDQGRCRQHLARAFPERSPDWIEATARRCFRHFGRMGMWTLATLHRPPQALRRDVRWRGLGQVAASLAASRRGEGTLICSGHLGNWELLARVTGTVFPVTLLGKKMRHPEVDRIITRMRGHGQNRTAYQEDGVRACVRELRDGRLMATLPDQDIKRMAGCFVPWFGAPAYTPSGPVTIAALGRARVQPVYCVWEGDAWALYWGPRWSVPRDLPREEAAAVITARVIAWQEALVRRHPEQWAWWHKRWRTRPEDRPDAVVVG